MTELSWNCVYKNCLISPVWYLHQKDGDDKKLQLREKIPETYTSLLNKQLNRLEIYQSSQLNLGGKIPPWQPGGAKRPRTSGAGSRFLRGHGDESDDLLGTELDEGPPEKI